MKTGFQPLPPDSGFAKRCAKYLEAHGYRAPQIRTALVNELQLPPQRAHAILEAITH